MTEIPTEALEAEEAAARAIAELHGEAWLFDGRYPQYEKRRARYRAAARAAAPYLIAEGRRQAEQHPGSPNAAAEAQVIEAARRLTVHWSHPRPRAASVGYDEAEHRNKAMLTRAVLNLDAAEVGHG